MTPVFLRVRSNGWMSGTLLEGFLWTGSTSSSFSRNLFLERLLLLSAKISEGGGEPTVREVRPAVSKPSSRYWVTSCRPPLSGEIGLLDPGREVSGDGFSVWLWTLILSDGGENGWLASLDWIFAMNSLSHSKRGRLSICKAGIWRRRATISLAGGRSWGCITQHTSMSSHTPSSNPWVMQTLGGGRRGRSPRLITMGMIKCEVSQNGTFPEKIYISSDSRPPLKE